MANMTGGCLCGQIKYTASGDPAFSGLCHCRNCQRYTGSAFETVVAFPSSAVANLIQWHSTAGDDAAVWPGRAAQESAISAAGGDGGDSDADDSGEADDAGDATDASAAPGPDATSSKSKPSGTAG